MNEEGVVLLKKKLSSVSDKSAHGYIAANTLVSSYMSRLSWVGEVIRQETFSRTFDDI